MTGSVPLRRRLRRAARVAVAAVVLVVLARSAEDWLAGDWLRSDLEQSVRRVREHSDADGYDVVRVGAVRTESAESGERVRVSLGWQPAGEVAVAASCDEECTDLALRLLDRNGEELARDAAGDAVPVVSTVLRDAGRYDLEIDMRGCDARRCRYAWQLLRIESRDGGSDGSTGSCFAVGPSGLLLTARHVLEGAQKIDVRFPDGETLPATVERDDEALDVALLRVHAPTPEYLDLVRPGAVHLGEPVFTIGFPAVDVLGEEPKFADGTIGALSGLEHDPPSLQLSIPVQPGSSGSPVVNDRGEVVGLVESVADADFFGGDSGLVPQSLSWAVKAEAIRAFVPAAPPRPPAASRADAVSRVLRAVCLVETR